MEAAVGLLGQAQDHPPVGDLRLGSPREKGRRVAVGPKPVDRQVEGQVLAEAFAERSLVAVGVAVRAVDRVGARWDPGEKGPHRHADVGPLVLGWHAALVAEERLDVGPRVVGGVRHALVQGHRRTSAGQLDGPRADLQEHVERRLGHVLDDAKLRRRVHVAHRAGWPLGRGPG